MNVAISNHERQNTRTQHVLDVYNTMIQLLLMIYVAVRERQILLKDVKNTAQTIVMNRPKVLDSPSEGVAVQL
jgi:hypothetical protein